VQTSLAEDGRHLAATDLAKPSEKQRFSAERAHAFNDTTHCPLHDFFGEIGIGVDASHREPKQTGKVLPKEGFEGVRIAARDTLRQLPVFMILREIHVWSHFPVITGWFDMHSARFPSPNAKKTAVGPEFSD
jgi:hypothetical protein